MISLEEKSNRQKLLTDHLSASIGIYLANFNGINVEKFTELRKSLRESGASMRVVKNRLLKRVFGELKIKGMDEALVGPTSLIVSKDDPIAPAKLIVEFHKKNPDMLPIKIVRIDGSIFPGNRIKELAKMPGKAELQAQIISLALSPAAMLISLIKGPGSKIAGQIKAQIEKLEK